MWETVRLGELLDVQNGYAFNSKQFSLEGKHPLIRIRDLKNGFKTKTRYDGEYDEKYVVKAGDFLIGMDGEFRCYEWKGENALLNQRVCRLQNFSNKLNSRFLFYAINGKLKMIEDNTGYITVKHLSSKSINEIELPLPSLAEQQRIVAKLDAAFSEIDKAIAAEEEKLKETELLFQHFLTEKYASLSEQEAISTTLGEYYDVRDGTHDSPKYVNKGFPLVTSKNLKGGTLNIDSAKFISETDYNQIIKRSGVAKGDVLMAMIGTIGNPIVIAEEPQFAIKNVALFKINEKQSGQFLKYYLDSSKVIKKLHVDAKGATQKFVGLGYLRNFPINIPSFENQLLLVNELDNISVHTNRLRSLIISKTQNLLSLKSSMLEDNLTNEAA